MEKYCVRHGLPGPCPHLFRIFSKISPPLGTFQFIAGMASDENAVIAFKINGSAEALNEIFQTVHHTEEPIKNNFTFSVDDLTHPATLQTLDIS
jgi:hypothetical protein